MVGDLSDTLALAEQLPAIDEFWHFAGLTEFHEDKRAQLERVNVEGTRQALLLAEQLGVRRFFHISTAYVCGLTSEQELVPEDGLLPAPRFRNPYEETKYRGECLVRASALPWVILRPSIIMGHSRTGVVESDKMVYGAIKACHLVTRLVRREHRDLEAIPNELVYYVRGRPEVALNLICVDDVVAMLLRARCDAEPGRTYHCVHHEPTSLDHLHTIVFDRLQSPYLRLQPEFPANQDRRQRLIDRSISLYADYMLQPNPRFDQANQQHLLNGQAPQTLDERLLGFLVERYLDDCAPQTAHRPEELATQLDLSGYPDVRRFGDFSLAYETLSRQFDAFRIPGISGFLAYTLLDSFAIMVADPITDQPADLLRAFVHWCAENNRYPCALQISERTARDLRQVGLAANKLGTETFLDLLAFDPVLKGKPYEATRNYFNIARRFGVRIEEHPLAEVSADEINRVSTTWLSTKKNSNELQLLLRPLTLTGEPDVRWFFAFSNIDRLLGFTSFTPLYQADRIIGYSANFQRFAVEHEGLPSRFNLMQTITLAAARVFRSEGLQTLAIGLSPLHNLVDSAFNDDAELLSLFQDLASRDELFAFSGIAHHKRVYPNRIERSVYYAAIKEMAGETMLQVLSKLGFLTEAKADAS